jgi:hypothetical protein
MLETSNERERVAGIGPKPRNWNCKVCIPITPLKPIQVETRIRGDAWATTLDFTRLVCPRCRLIYFGGEG